MDKIGLMAWKQLKRFPVELLFLGLALASLCWGLEAAIKGFEYAPALRFALLGLLLSWILAPHTRLSRVLLPLILAFGIMVQIVISAKLLAAISAFLGAGWYMAQQVGELLWQRLPLANLDQEPLALAFKEIDTLLSPVLIHLSVWIVGLLQRAPYYDLVAANLFWSGVTWSCALFAGWAFRRIKNPLFSIAPLGMLLAGSLNYTHQEVRILLPFGAAVFSLLALQNFKNRQTDWLARRLDMAEDVPVDNAFANGLVIIALLLIGLGVSYAPVLSARTINAWIQEMRKPQIDAEKEFAQSLGMQDLEEAPSVLERMAAGGLPRQHLLGSGPDLSERIVMTVRIVLPEGTNPPERPAQYYWRGMTYDIYTGQGWNATSLQEIGFAKGMRVQPGAVSFARLVEQEVHLNEDLGAILYAAGELDTVNQPFQVAWRQVYTTPVNLPSNLSIQFERDLFGATIDAEEYNVLSWVSAISTDTLAVAGDIYPEWVRRRYLALPDTIPSRLADLAAQITQDAANPYERAVRIESYLRSLPYTLELPAPPPDRDVVDYYLFDLKRGYCDYAASAMVVLARLSGLPARLAIGYASGAYDVANGRYLVSEADAHSWAEVYFPNIGWISFEPTGGRPAMDRDVSGLPSTTLPTLPESFLPEEGLAGQPWATWGALLGMLLLVGWWITSQVNWWKMLHQPASLTIIQVYRRFYRQARRLAVGLPAAHTPNEFAHAISERLKPVPRRHSRRGKAKPEQGFAAQAQRFIERLTDLYNQTMYSEHIPAEKERAESLSLERRLRRPLLLRSFLDRFSRKGRG